MWSLRESRFMPRPARFCLLRLTVQRCSSTLLTLSLLLLPKGLVAQDQRSKRNDLPASAPGVIDFQRDIQPIFQRTCWSCHGPDKQRSGLRLDERSAALKGGNSGVAIKPGDAE